MWQSLRRAAKATHDWVRPWCPQCGKHAFRHNHCSLCGRIDEANRADALRKNFTNYDLDKQLVRDAAWVCETCFLDNVVDRCSKTNHVFKAKHDRRLDYLQSKMRENLTPHHPDSKLRGAISPEGFSLIEVEHQAFQERLANWAGGTKHESIRGFRIIREIGTIRCNEKCDDPASVEHSLKQHTAQVGGNGFIKLFWDKHIEHHDEEYVAGYGRRGNPYYRNRHHTTQHFTGHAIAVVAEPSEPRSKKAGTP